MSRYAVTYRIDGGPGLSGWAERTCNGVNVYANKDDMTPVNGATIVTYSDVPTEVHVVPTTKDCNGGGSVAVYDKCAVNLLEQIERNTRMATTVPTTQPRSVAVVSTGKLLQRPVVSDTDHYATPIASTSGSFDASGITTDGDYAYATTAWNATENGTIARVVVSLTQSTGVLIVSGFSKLDDASPSSLKYRVAISATPQHVFDANTPFTDVSFPEYGGTLTATLYDGETANGYAIIEFMGTNIQLYNDYVPLQIYDISTYKNSLIIGNTYLFRRVPDSNGADDFSNVGAPNVQSFGTFVATGTTPNIWKETLLWDVTSAQPAVLYNTTGFDISASYVEYGEYDIAVKIESSQFIFDRPASFTTYGGLGNVISVDGGTVLAHPGGRVFHETFKLQEN